MGWFKKSSTTSHSPTTSESRAAQHSLPPTPRHEDRVPAQEPQPSTPRENSVLRDPGLDDTDPKQLGYQLFNSCGLTFLVWGPGSLADCFTAWSEVAPAMTTTQTRAGFMGAVGGREDSVWVGYANDDSSAIAYHCFPDGDIQFIQREIAMNLRHLSTPWKWGLGTVGASLPEDAAQIIQEADVIPVWRLPQLSHLTPAPPATTGLPEPTRVRLLDEGWEPVNGDHRILKGVASPTPGRTQLLYIIVWDESTVALMSPVTESPTKEIPEDFHNKDFNGYSVEMLTDMVTLCHRLPLNATAPSYEQLLEQGMLLATYADQVESSLSPEDRF